MRSLQSCDNTGECDDVDLFSTGLSKLAHTCSQRCARRHHVIHQDDPPLDGTTRYECSRSVALTLSRRESTLRALMHPLQYIRTYGQAPTASQHAGQIARTVNTAPGDATVRAGDRHDQISCGPRHGRDDAGGCKLGDWATRAILPTAHEFVTDTSECNC